MSFSTVVSRSCFNYLFAGARLAIELVNADNTTLPSHELALIFNDTQCRADVAMNNFIKLMLMQDHSFKILGILGGLVYMRVCACMHIMCVSFGDLTNREK